MNNCDKIKKMLPFFEVTLSLVILLLFIKPEQFGFETMQQLQLQSSSAWQCTELDTSLLTIKLSEILSSTLHSDNKLKIRYQYQECENCDFLDLHEFNSTSLSSSTTRTTTTALMTIDSFFSYLFRVESTKSNSTICDTLKFGQFKECAEFVLYVDDVNQCRIEISQNFTDTRSYIQKNPLIFGLRLLVFFLLATNLFEKYYPKLSKTEARTENKAKSTSRLNSLDTFRGVSLFLMIFVNYGGGGYKFLQHEFWHGATIADFLFPWFLWIMGFAIPLATNSVLSRGSQKRVLFKKICIRTAKLFAIGLMLNTRAGVDLAHVRYFGVLQRIALCYFLVATLELVLYKKIEHNSKFHFLSDLVWSRAHLAIMFVISAVWFYLVFMTQVPGCPVGYIGPGGLHQNSAHFNCTGGMTGYLDKTWFGEAHLYSWPTPKKIYRTTETFDPEGVLGLFTSIVTTYLGAQAARVLVFYKNQPAVHLALWSVWGFVCLLVYYLLTGFDQINGWMPVNKNLWTLSYVQLTASSSFFLFSVLYFLVDVLQCWSGNPFVYLGLNSILIYVFHVLFGKMLPVYFKVSHTHLAQFLMNFWGSVVWTLVAIYLYWNKIFVSF